MKKIINYIYWNNVIQFNFCYYEYNVLFFILFIFMLVYKTIYKYKLKLLLNDCLIQKNNIELNLIINSLKHRFKYYLILFQLFFHEFFIIIKTIFFFYLNFIIFFVIFFLFNIKETLNFLKLTILRQLVIKEIYFFFVVLIVFYILIIFVVLPIYRLIYAFLNYILFANYGLWFHICLWYYEYIPFFAKYVLFLPYTKKYIYYLAVGSLIQRVMFYYKYRLLYKAILLKYSSYLYTNVNLFFVRKAKRIKKFFIYWFVYETTIHCSVSSAILLYERCYFLFAASILFYVYVIQLKYNGQIVLTGPCPFLENPFDMHHPPIMDIRISLPSPPLNHDLEYQFKEVEEQIYPKPKFPSLLDVLFFISIAWGFTYL